MIKANNTIKLAIVEDNQEIGEYLLEIFNNHEFIDIVALYINCNDAIKFIPQHDLDVVLMDIGLPDRSGLFAVKELKEINAKVEFIMHTIFDSGDQVFEALKLGATGYLLKNTPPAKLIASIVEVYNGGSPMSPSIARKVTEYFDHRKVNDSIASLLTERELTILKLMSNGLLYKEIASELDISIGTVKQHNHKIYQKLHVQNKTEAINKYLGR